MRKLLILSCLLLLSACGSPAKSALEQFLEAYYTKNFDAAYALTDSAYKKKLTQQQYREAMLKDPFIIMIIERSLYHIKDVEVTGDMAKAEVQITLPDRVGLTQFVFSQVAQVDPHSALSPEAGWKKAVESMKGKHVPMVKEMQTFTLVKEGEDWKVKLQ